MHHTCRGQSYRWYKKERKIAGPKKLQFDTLIPFKNHPDGLECFSYNVVHYTSKLAPRHFVVALDAVIADKSTNQNNSFSPAPNIN